MEVFGGGMAEIKTANQREAGQAANVISSGRRPTGGVVTACGGRAIRAKTRW